MKQSTACNGITASLVLFTLTVAAVAPANTPGKLEGTKATVVYADLNLGSEAGIQALYLRLKRASREVCGVTSFKNAGSAYQIKQVKNCYRETLTEAVENIDNELLTRIHAS